MEPERWRRVQELFDRALERPPEERAAFLEEVSGEDRELRAEVAAMLAADSEAGDFLEEAVRGGAEAFDQATDPLRGRKVFGKYELVGKLGEGGFGQVFESVDPVLKRAVAIKVCTSADSHLRRRFFREAEIAARLQHPNIVTVHDLGVSDGVPYLVQELLQGEDLNAKILRRDELSVAVRLDILEQIAQGLAYAHGEGVLHRDVKPSNVRVLDGGRVKILDFGIARLIDERNPLTVQGSTLGTAAYLAPEQLSGSEVEPRSDVFSFGVVAYELLTYRRPFRGATFPEVSYQLLYENPAPLRALWPDCPARLDRLIGRCLAKKPDQRVESFERALAELAGIRGSLPAATAEAPPATIAMGSSPRTSRVLKPLAVSAGLLLAASLALPVLSDRMLGPEPDGGVGALQPPPRQASGTQPSGKAEGLTRPAGGASLQTEERSPIDDPPTTSEPSSEGERDLEAGIEDEGGTLETGDLAAIGTLETATGGDRLRAFHPEPTPAGAAPTEQRPPAEENEAPEEVAQEPPTPAEPPLFTPEQEGVVGPVLLDLPEPTYPRRAELRRKEATIVLAVLVDAEGRSEHVVVKKGSEDRSLGFEDAAVEVARQARFEPATRKGVAGKMWTEVSVEFVIP